MHDNGLEELVGRRLRALPDPEAPPTLWPRIRDAVEERLARPWYRRPWRSWPPALRAGSTGLVTAALAGWALAWAADPGFWSWVPGLVRGGGALAAAGSGALVTAVDVLRRAYVEPVALYVLAVALGTGTATAVLGTAFRQAVTIGGTSES